MKNPLEKTYLPEKITVVEETEKSGFGTLVLGTIGLYTLLWWKNYCDFETAISAAVIFFLLACSVIGFWRIRKMTINLPTKNQLVALRDLLKQPPEKTE